MNLSPVRVPSWKNGPTIPASIKPHQTLKLRWTCGLLDVPIMYFLVTSGDGSFYYILKNVKSLFQQSIKYYQNGLHFDDNN